MSPEATPQPSPAPQPAPSPPPQSNPAAASQPAPGDVLDSFMNIDVHKERRNALLLAIASLAVFVLGILFGYAALVGAILGAISLKIAKPLKAKGIMIIATIGALLNLAVFFLAVLVG